MTFGLITSMLVTFTLLPSLINIINEKKIFILKTNENSKVTRILSNFTLQNKNIVFATSILVVLISFFGITKLQVENSFIKLFSEASRK